MICFYELYSFKSGICCVFIRILKLMVAMKKCRHNQSMSRNANIKFRGYISVKVGQLLVCPFFITGKNEHFI